MNGSHFSKSMYEESGSADGEKSSVFSVEQGVTQCCSLSPTFGFSIYLQIVERNTKKRLD